MSSNQGRGTFSQNNSPSSSPSLNGRILLGSLTILFLIVLLILGLHVYAKWFWRRSNRRQASWRRRLGLDIQAHEPPKTGLDKAVVESLPTFTYKVMDPLLQKDVLECAVCLSEFQDEEKGRILPKCSHQFHINCIDMWFLSNTTCPLCRVSAEPAILESNAEPNEVAGVSALRHSAREATPQSGNGEEQGNAGRESLQNRFGSLLRRQLSLQSLGARSWRRSISDRFPQLSQGVQFPTNVLFWGNHSHVNSRINPEHWQVGGRSLPHIVIEVPRRQDTLLIRPRSASTSPSYCSPTIDDQTVYSCPSVQQRPFSRVNSLKKLSSREKKALSSGEEPNISGATQGG